MRDKEAKRRGKVGRSVIVGVEGEEYIYIFLFKQGEEKFKKKKENVENKWMMWMLIWLNKSVTTINTTLQLLDIKMKPNE